MLKMRVQGLIAAGVTFFHVAPPSDVIWIWPSSVPAHRICTLRGDGESAGVQREVWRCAGYLGSEWDLDTAAAQVPGTRDGDERSLGEHPHGVEQGARDALGVWASAYILGGEHV